MLAKISSYSHISLAHVQQSWTECVLLCHVLIALLAGQDVQPLEKCHLGKNEVEISTKQSDSKYSRLYGPQRSPGLGRKSAELEGIPISDR